MSATEALRAQIRANRAARGGAGGGVTPPAVASRSTPAASGAATRSGGENSMEVIDGDDGERTYRISLASDATLDQLLDYYSDLTGRTMIKAPGVNATISVTVRDPLTRAEAIQLMDAILTQNSISLIPLGSRFYRVVQVANAATDGLQIMQELPGSPEGFESDAVVSQLIRLQHLEMEDANTLVTAMIHSFGKVQRLDRINSLLIMDTVSNLRRIVEVLEMVDQPTETKVETRVYEIKHAKASDIAARLNELIDSQEKKEQTEQVTARPVRRPPNMIRARQPGGEAAESASSSSTPSEQDLAAQGIVQGKVKILTDERTNIIIVISRPSNFTLFDRIVDVLDRSVEPEVIVKVLALEFAEAEEMASLLNDFIGAAKAEDSNAPRSSSSAGDSRARALEDYVSQRAAAADRINATAGSDVTGKIGQLSSNTKILADKRTNSILLMGTKSDIIALEAIVDKVDIMLAQVLIEAVILEVNLNNTTSYGVSWLQKSMTAYSEKTIGGATVRDPFASWGGGFLDGNFSENSGASIGSGFNPGNMLKYYFTFPQLNMDMLLSMVADSGEARVLATPVIVTTDNTEASIMSGQQIPTRTGDTESSGGTYYSNYQYKDVGVKLEVKPRINPTRYVTLEITQSADTLGDQVSVGTSGTMHSINKREMKASISVPSRSTIALGGLVQTDYSSSTTRVPILGDIPIIGWFFRSENKNRRRTELLVLITPYVMMTQEEARAETERLHKASNVAAEDWYRGWSDSSLAPFSPEKEKEMQEEEKENKRRAKVRAVWQPYTGIPADAESDVPPVALVDVPPITSTASPEPEILLNPEDFSQAVERMMREQNETLDLLEQGQAGQTPLKETLPPPASPPTTAPYIFNPAVLQRPSNGDSTLTSSPASVPVVAEADEPPAAPRRALFSWRKKTPPEEPKPSMFAAPATTN